MPPPASCAAGRDEGADASAQRQGKASKFATLLAKALPEHAGIAADQRAAWAGAVAEAVLRRHANSSDAEKEVKRHQRSLLFNVKENGVHLVRQYTAVELAALSSERLGETSTDCARRHKLHAEQMAAEAALLGQLPHGARVALLTLLGSLCPITTGHVQCFEDARKLLLRGGSPAGRFAECLGHISLNPDSHVQWKVAGEFAGFGGTSPLTFESRQRLVELATAHLSWLRYSSRKGYGAEAAAGVRSLQERWPHLRIVHFELNGADDVVKYRKWTEASPQRRFLTMRRPGYDSALRIGLLEAKMPPDGSAEFVLGPMMPCCSSTDVRRALRDEDLDVLNKMLHPAVLAWFCEQSLLAVPAEASQRDSASSQSHSVENASSLQNNADSFLPTLVVAQRMVADERQRMLNELLQGDDEDSSHPLASSASRASKRQRVSHDAGGDASAQRQGKASKFATLLAKALPEHAGIAADQRAAWAGAVAEAVLRRHANSSDAEKEVKRHQRSLLFNVKENGVHLVRQYTAVELAALSSERLAEGTAQDRRLQAIDRGELDWQGSFADPPPVLLGDTLWTREKRKLVLATEDSAASRALLQFFGAVERVHVVCGSIFDQDGRVDAFVSPANTYGNMDGGIDAAYAKYFGWSPGRPYHSANPVQLAIDATRGSRPCGAELPIGSALVVEVQGSNNCAIKSVRYLVASPTMRVPGAIALRSRTVYKAARAAFEAWRGHQPMISSLAMPMFGTGWGRVPYTVAAAQMWEAFVDAWTPR